MVLCILDLINAGNDQPVLNYGHINYRVTTAHTHLRTYIYIRMWYIWYIYIYHIHVRHPRLLRCPWVITCYHHYFWQGGHFSLYVFPCAFMGWRMDSFFPSQICWLHALFSHHIPIMLAIDPFWSVESSYPHKLPPEIERPPHHSRSCNIKASAIGRDHGTTAHHPQKKDRELPPKTGPNVGRKVTCLNMGYETTKVGRSKIKINIYLRKYGVEYPKGDKGDMNKHI